MEDKDFNFLRNVLWFDETNWIIIALITIVVLGGKIGDVCKLKKSITMQHLFMSEIYCKRDWWTSQNRWHHEKGKLYLILRHHPQSLQVGCSNRQWSQAYFQSCDKMTYGHQSQDTGVAITNPWSQSNRKYVDRTE